MQYFIIYRADRALLPTRTKMHSMLLMLFFVTAVARIHEGLQNKAVIAGKATQMTCEPGSEAKIHWFYTSPKDPRSRHLYDGTKILPDTFSNINATGRVHGQILNIDPVQLENSGLFKCIVRGEQRSAQLIVLESMPVCGTTSNASLRGFVDMWCRLNYTGFWPLRMQWIQGDSKLISQEERSSTSLLSTLTIKETNASYSCETYFTAEDNTLKNENQTVKNVPNFTSIFTSEAIDKSTTHDQTLNYEATTRHTSISNNGIIWILTSCAALACLIVFVVIVRYLRKLPDGCRKSTEPDLVQNAEVIQNGANPAAENRVDMYPPELGPAFEAGEPEEVLDHNRVYAEVVIIDRRLPPHMQDSPAWNNLHNDICGRSIQNSPAWSHSSKNVPPSRSATPRNGSPMVNVEDIEYLDINSVAPIPVPQGQPPRRPPARLPTFQLVNYASIDHTSRPPPPPPPSDN